MKCVNRSGAACHALTILSVSPIPEDHCTIKRILNEFASGAGNRTGWRLATTTTLTGAMSCLRDSLCKVVVCERDLFPGNWKDLLERTRYLAHPPAVIVTSRHADDHLWAEALNMGAYDVLAKPFDEVEVTRVLGLACSRWSGPAKPPAGAAGSRP